MAHQGTLYVFGKYDVTGEDGRGEVVYTSRAEKWPALCAPLLASDSPSAPPTSPPTFSHISAGPDHVVAISESGKLYSWGVNYGGQLGIALETAVVHHATPIISNVSFRSVSAGAHHSAAVSDSGQVYVWGSNAGGVLGLGHSAPDCVPTPTHLHLPHRCSAVSCGSYHTIALTEKGQIYVWGSGFGALGDDDDFLETPTHLHVTDPASGSNVLFKAVSAGDLHSLALDTEGRCWAWGYNFDGRLGLGSHSPFAVSSPTPITRVRSASGNLKPAGVGGVIWSRICAGFSHSALIDSNGTIFTFGRNSYGVLGLNTTSEYVSIPTPITQFDTSAGPVTSLGVRFADVIATRYATLALAESGALYSCGSAGSWSDQRLNRLGHQTTTSCPCQPVSQRFMLVAGDSKDFSTISYGHDFCV
eukprot:TRINITY_DN4945_c0_g1_i1.p1 TRINITY_DN4945_c0_g1~~TRINITY_DN4945_c0_g1_i1.p1  ORF type:complete len:417 (-),score=24.99 TRINITY_DN4945_c0_g1_i1:9-1259(-)